MSSWHGGKGSAPRKGRDDKAYAENWEKIFGSKNEAEKPNNSTTQKPSNRSESNTPDHDKH